MRLQQLNYFRQVVGWQKSIRHQGAGGEPGIFSGSVRPAAWLRHRRRPVFNGLIGFMLLPGKYLLQVLFEAAYTQKPLI
jgi:hypothetical protein